MMILPVRSAFRKFKQFQPAEVKAPLRAELFSLEQLVRHATDLAEQHQIFHQPGRNPLLAHLDENEIRLRDFNRDTQQLDQNRQVTPAAEWLLDNFYLIEEQIQLARRHLPRSYNRELPRLSNGSSKGFPRIYDLILELISHVDAQIDIEPLSAFIAAYQTRTPLKLGELWATPIMLRLGLIENLQRVATRLTVARNDRNLAEQWIERLQETAEKNPSDLVVIMAEMSKTGIPASSSFVANFCQGLARQSQMTHWVRNWLEQRLTEQGLSIEELIHQENQIQAADQVTISHSIVSLRFISAMDWREFVETVSLVDATLRLDPADIYGDMDFATRDRYRHSIETLAKHSKLTEGEIAEAAIALAKNAGSVGRLHRTSHVGYYLIGRGLPALEKAVGMRGRPIRTTLEESVRRAPLSFYLGQLALLTLIGAGAAYGYAAATGVGGLALFFIVLASALGFSQLALSLLNLAASYLVSPRLLPRLDFKDGIPSDCRTMVIVPTILGNSEDADRLIETLEIHYLANRGSCLHFGLLTDFPDASEAELPGDDALLARAREGVEGLNRKYEIEEGDRFHLFHRPRRWNASEGCWMGYERKRGKISEFNSLLRERGAERFSLIVGSTRLLPSIKYVITLDTDTQLPQESAYRLVGTLAHPLNHARFDEEKQIVIEGYGILQPRVGVTLPSASRSLFARLFAGEVGLDPYTLAASDTYQDIFGEGSFIGKGIYDVDAFEQASANRFAENTILSHDLIESGHARSGLVSDVEFYEDYPTSYSADISRKHRWIRGDWQIFQWLLPKVRQADGTRIVNPLSALSRWKIFDNLRRSLVPITLLILILVNWLLLPQLGWAGVALLLAVLILSPWLGVLAALFQKSSEVPLAMHLRGIFENAGRQFLQACLHFAFLPYEALMSADAIGRTVVRLNFTHKHLLEWRTAREAEQMAGRTVVDFYRMMAFAPALALIVSALLIAFQSPILFSALPVLILWALSPWMAWRISRPTAPPLPEFSDEEQLFLRRTARKTWRYFETFVTESENWLPPDNYQQEPVSRIASRTSPTNIGLALLANLTARDFGYISIGRFIDRTEKAFSTMQRMERHRGHFYNWYDNQTLKPLRPLYVSSVDSGNLAGHLMTLGSGIQELIDQPVFDQSLFDGLRDACQILKDVSGPSIELEKLKLFLASPPKTLRLAYTVLQEIQTRLDGMSFTRPTNIEETQWWLQALKCECQDHLDELLFTAPWLEVPSMRVGDQSPHIQSHLHLLEEGLTLREIAELDQSFSPWIEEGPNLHLFESPEGKTWLSRLRLASERASDRIRKLAELAQESNEFANMDFKFLFDVGRNLFTIGFNAEDFRHDASYYDLLASEARLCSYVAIAQGQVSKDHWFSLGRLLLASRGNPVLASWSGSLFEYLMPLLVMPDYDDTLLHQTYLGAVKNQIDYGRSRSIPWGISESGYNRTDTLMNYQYRAFGVPGLGLKRGLADDLVIAPYATVMALMVLPRPAYENLIRLAEEKREGIYGFYEAIDYTPSRLAPGQTSATIQSFMVHHQGMSLLALSYVLLGRPMQRRFLACPSFKATELLLQERIPKTVADVLRNDLASTETKKLTEEAADVMRVITQPSLPAPEVHLLSNGRYHVMISSAGGGYSRWNDLAITRWREDATLDSWGTFIYLRDVDTGEFWSAAYQPTRHTTKNYEAIFTQGRAEFRQRRAEIEVHTEISVSPEDDVELRRVTLTNHASGPQKIEVTSYAEVVLAPPSADATHPAFSNLFVQTEWAPQYGSLLCTRRARSKGDQPPWLFHLIAGQGGETSEVTYETNRTNFIGRGHTPDNPRALHGEAKLANTVGPVLDPIISLRYVVTIPANESVRVDFILGAAPDRNGALGLAEKYNSPRMAERTLDLAWTHSLVTLRHLNISEAEAVTYSRLASSMIYADPARRASASLMMANRRGQNGLWSFGISGDLPIVLLRISDRDRMALVQQLIQAHSYWRLKGLAVDLVILNEDDSLYRQSLHDEIVHLIASGLEAQVIDKPGGIFVRHTDQISNEDRVLLQTVARAVLLDENGSLSDQMERSVIPAFQSLPLNVTRQPFIEAPPLPFRELIMHNGVGGFTPDGREYVITLQPDQETPAPWANVLANPYFGTVISESGSAYTWYENCHEFRLTPWTNDPVSDPSGEAFYIRDEHTGQFWSPTPRPARGRAPYLIRHGFGYSVFEHTENGISSELWIYVAPDAPVKFARLKVRNVSNISRRISATGYWEWVLGELRQKNLLHIQTEIDSKSGALLIRNSYNADFADRLAYVDVNEIGRTFTNDRREFLGRNGTAANPAAMRKSRLSGKTGAGLDPCTAIQVAFDLDPGQEREVCFRMGVGKSAAEVQTLIHRYRRPDAPRVTLEAVWKHWNDLLGTVYVETPDPAVNFMTNGWLLYQTLSCRIWARSGFYQSGGAYGFRDQLQDVMALVNAAPGVVREQLLRAAAHQFREGDVQHWWHPPTGRGVRTHFSDDYLWLPYVVCHYVLSVQDTGVLDETIPFLESRLLRPDEEADYDLPSRSSESASLYEHCVRSIEYGLKFGVHGLPLIGCGDWNDGMNRIGKDGKGESVWLAFFLYDVLMRFSEIARDRNDIVFADRCVSEAKTLQQNIESQAWDGEWYRRAYFDNGEPLGSHLNPECQIDSLPQSWSVISGAGNPKRSAQAMQAVEKRLVRSDAGLIQLFDPPFDKSDLDPGYIKGYIPGVRENGGQYTHAAIWTIMAFAKMGQIDRAWELFDMLNPARHGDTEEKINLYKVEPYVVAADVYGNPPHTGRGGWTWYTGSAGWMYRLLIETLFGLQRKGDQLYVTPRLPKKWNECHIHYRHHTTRYHIHVVTGGAKEVPLRLDGQPLPQGFIPLIDDGQDHAVEIII